MRSACRRRRASLRTGSHLRTILARTRPILVGHAVELATAQPPPTTTARSKPTPRLAQHRLRQLRTRGADSGRPRAGHGRSGRPRRPRPSQPYGGCPPPRSTTSLRPDTADAATHRHRTPDSGHLAAQTPAPDTGHDPVDRQAWTLVARTGHRTPDTGRWPRTRTGDDGAAGIRTSWATTPSHRALGRPTVFLWTAPAALGSPYRLGGEATFQREITSRRQLLGRSAGVERRLGALLSSDEFRVERRANGEASSVMARAQGWIGTELEQGKVCRAAWRPGAEFDDSGANRGQCFRATAAVPSAAVHGALSLPSVRASYRCRRCAAVGALSLFSLGVPQGDSLRIAFGSRSGSAPDRFLVGWLC
jgi:hypothetical protein